MRWATHYSVESFSPSNSSFFSFFARAICFSILLHIDTAPEKSVQISRLALLPFSILPGFLSCW